MPIWTTETVATTGRVGSYCSLAFDASGYPHISHRRGDSPNRALKYTYKDGSGWHTETVDGTDVLESSIAIDASGYPHISYYDWGPNDLKYAYKDGTGWHIATVDSAGDVGRGSSLALDSSGYSHIAYHKEIGPDELKYAYNGSGSWVIETVFSAGNAGYRPAMVLDTGDNPHISADYNTDLTWTYKIAGVWTIDNSGESYYINAGAHIGLDSSGYPHISIQNHIPAYLRYGYKDGAGWHFETVDAGPEVGAQHSLVMLNDSPIISYQGNDYSDAVLMYAYRDGTGWHSEVVDDGGTAKGWSNSIKLDGNGNPAIAYSDLDNSDLKYAYVAVAVARTYYFLA